MSSAAGLARRQRNVDRMRLLAQIAVLALAYWATGRLGLDLSVIRHQVTPVWPPTGIAVFALFVFGRQVAPGIFLGALAVNLPLGPTPVGAAVIAVGNTLAPVFAVELLRMVGFNPAFVRLRDAAAITGLAGLIGMSVSATFGTTVLIASGSADVSMFWTTWLVWWTGDVMGVLLFAPFLFSLLPDPTSRRLGLRGVAELVALLVATGVVTFTLFVTRLRVEYLVFPLIMVSAWRFRLRGAAPAALMASGIAIWSAIQGVGPFASESLVLKMVSLQSFNVCVALTSFVLACYVASRKRQQEMSLELAAATAASDAKSAFLNVAAHELRTPITVINGYLSMLADGSLGEPPDPWLTPLGVLSDKTDELEKIVEDLLDASRIEAERLRLDRDIFDLRAAVQAAVERARPRAELLGADMSAELGGDRVMVDADEYRIGRVVDNLINNSLSYSERPARVHVDLSVDDGHAVVRVEDQGVGIPEDQWDAVFERFHRREPRGLDQTPGVGLGLYISRQLAERHGGRLVLAHSAPGEGSTFELTLPLVVAVQG